MYSLLTISFDCHIKLCDTQALSHDSLNYQYDILSITLVGVHTASLSIRLLMMTNNIIDSLTINFMCKNIVLSKSSQMLLC